MADMRNLTIVPGVLTRDQACEADWAGSVTIGGAPWYVDAAIGLAGDPCQICGREMVRGDRVIFGNGVRGVEAAHVACAGPGSDGWDVEAWPWDD